MTRDRYGTGSIWRDGKKWRVRVGGRYAGRYDSEHDAEIALAAALAKLDQLPVRPGASLYVAGEHWHRKLRERGVRSIKSIESRWRSIVKGAPFSQYPIETITRNEVREWIYLLLKSYSHQTVKHVLGEISRCYEWCVDTGMIAVNPVRGLKMPPRQERQAGWTWLQPAEITAVLALELSTEQRTVLTVAIYQGLRQGEIAALQWDELDLDRGSVTVSRSWDGATKSGRSRTVDLAPVVAEALRRWREFSQAGDTGLVFPSPHGVMYGHGYDWGWGDRRFRSGDIPTRAGIRRRVRFHDLRHTCASNLISGNWGVPWRLEEVREFLGHADLKTTMRYAHLAPDGLRSKIKNIAPTLLREYSDETRKCLN